MTAAELTASGIVAGYGAADEVLKGVDFTASAGEITCIIGPNGAGKSTLLKAISGLVTLKTGRVILGAVDLTGKLPAEIARAGVAYVPQEHNVFSAMSVAENLEMGGYVAQAQTKRRIASACERFPMLGKKLRLPARALSGGERQVLAMAMALMVEPRVLLLDEPTAGLSPMAAEALIDTIVDINRGGLTIAMVEQNANEALAIAHKAYILVDGRNQRTGPAKALAADPEIQRIFLGG